MVVQHLHTVPSESSTLSITTKFPLVVKWYNSRLITGHYKFDSCREDQVKDSNSKLKTFTVNETKMLSCFIMLAYCVMVAQQTLTLLV